MAKQTLGMDEIDLQMERESNAMRRKNEITPDRRRKNDEDRPERPRHHALDRLLTDRHRHN